MKSVGRGKKGGNGFDPAGRISSFRSFVGTALRFGRVSYSLRTVVRVESASIHAMRRANEHDCRMTSGFERIDGSSVEIWIHQSVKHRARDEEWDTLVTTSTGPVLDRIVCRRVNGIPFAACRRACFSGGRSALTVS